jgi:hypothetical protein
MSKRLEDFIKANREEFDEIEPSADLWARIEKHLPPVGEEPEKRQAKTFSLWFVMRVAATVVLVMGLGFALYIRNEKKPAIDFAAINPVYARQQVQYTSLIQTKRSELKSVSKSDPELYKEFSAQIAQMDATYKELNSELITSPNQERVLRAMIRNLKIQADVLNQQLKVLEEMKEMKNGKNNEIKAI